VTDRRSGYQDIPRIAIGHRLHDRDCAVHTDR
jgi:hypothetical protein